MEDRSAGWEMVCVDLDSKIMTIATIKEVQN